MFANTTKLAIFAVFVVLGMIAARTPTPHRRRAVNALLIYVLTINLLVGITQRDCWPFCTYPLVPNRYDEYALNSRMEYYGIASDGRLIPLDPYVWSPLFPVALDLWFKFGYPSLGPAQKQAVMSFLFARASAGMQKLGRGERIGPQRILGSVALPDWWLYIHPPAYGGELRGLRVVHLQWRAADRLVESDAGIRTVVAEWIR
jgi:hypothetical protein